MALDPVEVFQTAIQRVPAYRKFLETQGGAIPEMTGPEDFSTLPLMDKTNYIQAYPLAERCLDGTVQGSHVIMHSSGSSGRYLYWPCRPEVEKNYWRSVYDELDANFQITTRPTLLVLGVLMGGNMSGALFAYALRAMGIEMGKTTLVTPGRDEEACLEVIKEFSPQFEQTILYSYPATAKNILENAKARGIPVEQFGIKLRLLGEGYSETYRDRLNALLGYPAGSLDSLNSGYGATDFRSAGRESLLCVAIKRLLHEQGKVREVLDLDDIPTICQYDPDAIHIEEVDGELVMTRHNAVPLIRYRSGDNGRVIGYEQMLALLAAQGLDPLKLLMERGCDPARVGKRPFVLVTGRRDGITFHGIKIYVGKVKSVLEETPWLAERLTGEFQLRKTEGAELRPLLDLAVVCRPDGPATTPEDISAAFAEAFSARQGGIYSDLLASDRAAALPRVRIVRREEIMTSSGFKIRYLG